MGHVGVAIFFVVSGFCIHLSHVKSRERGYKNFFGRRFFRLYPAYAIAAGAFRFRHPAIPAASRLPAPALNFASHLLLLHNLFPQFAYTVDGPCWTIGVEVQLSSSTRCCSRSSTGWAGEMPSFSFSPSKPSPSLLPSIFFHFHAMGLISYMTLTPFYYWFSWSIGAKVADDWMGGRPIFLARFPLWVLAPVLRSHLHGRKRPPRSVQFHLRRARHRHPHRLSSSPRFCRRLAAENSFRRTFSKSRPGQPQRLIFSTSALPGPVSPGFSETVSHSSPRPVRFCRPFHFLVFPHLPLVVGVAWISYRLIELLGIASENFSAATAPATETTTLRPDRKLGQAAAFPRPSPQLFPHPTTLRVCCVAYLFKPTQPSAPCSATAISLFVPVQR